MNYKVTITENPNRIRAEIDGVVYQGEWNDETEVVPDGPEDNENVLAACLMAWTGTDGTWEISEEELALRGGGFL